MQSSVWKITTWLWILVYVTLTSFSGHCTLSNAAVPNLEQQNEVHFSEQFSPYTQAIQPVSVEFVTAQFVDLQWRTYHNFSDLISLPIHQTIAFYRVHNRIDFNAIDCSFSREDHVFPFHYFW